MRKELIKMENKLDLSALDEAVGGLSASSLGSTLPAYVTSAVDKAIAEAKAKGITQQVITKTIVDNYPAALASQISQYIASAWSKLA